MVWILLVVVLVLVIAALVKYGSSDDVPVVLEGDDHPAD